MSEPVPANPPGTNSRAGFILVGGQSSRMGRDKALLVVDGVTLLETIAATVLLAAGNVTLVGPPAKYESFGFPVIPDLVENGGPLGGIFTALSSTPADWNLIVSCDLPDLSVELLESLFARAEATGADCVVPQTPDGLQPLCAVYHRRCLAAVKSAVDRKMLKMQDLISELRAEIVTAPVIKNVNTPQDFERITTHYIEFRNVYKTFDHPVLVDVNFNVDAGETLAIIGRSGVGKSVTLATLMGFIKPDQGQIIAAYTDISNFTEAEMRKIRKRITMVFQSGALFDSLTVAENILFSLELREDYDEKNKEDVVDGLLRMVDLQEFRDHYPTDLSTGHKRAVAIARALAAQPECILYDEPTTMVDPIMSDHLGNLMLRLKTQLQLTGVVVTHDLDLMRKVADRVVVLYEGSAIFFGPVTDLEKSEHPHIQEFLAMDRV
jgi:phospholipid/cholesterol/gamma-HCH transport system ATP-binding protein